MLLLPFIGIITGTVLGLIWGSALPIVFAKYLSVIAIAAFDSLLEGAKNLLENKFNNQLLLIGFIVSALLSSLFVFWGNKSGLDIYLVAMIALAVRIYQNLHTIIVYLLERKNNKYFINSGNHYTED